MLENGCENIILGCTHYPYLTSIFKRLAEEYGAENIEFINPAKYFTDFIKKDLQEKSLLSDKKESNEMFYVSSNPARFKESAKSFYELSSLPELKEV